jgi:hypothetical protein
MPTAKKRVHFKESELGVEIKQALIAMASDTRFNTVSSYSSNTTTYPDHLISFVDKHMEYLENHPTTDPGQYVSNLRLMTRIK